MAKQSHNPKGRQLAFLADPLSHFKIEKDSTYLMMQEAACHGYDLYAFEPADIVLRDGHVMASMQQITLNTRMKKNVAWYQATPAGTLPLSGFNAVLLRKDPPVDTEYLYTTYLLSLAQATGAQIFNWPHTVRNCNEKLAIAQFPQFMPPTLVTRDAGRFRAFHGEYQNVIMKPLDSMGGEGVFHIAADARNLGAIIETLTEHGKRTVMMQQFIPEIVSGGDKRILLIGGQVVPFALARYPQASEVRGNLAVGGKGVAQALSERDREIAETLAPLLWQQGLLVVGLDVIGDYLTEINVTSPTCFREITDETGFNVAQMWMNCLEIAIAKTTPPLSYS